MTSSAPSCSGSPRRPWRNGRPTWRSSALTASGSTRAGANSAAPKGIDRTQGPGYEGCHQVITKLRSRIEEQTVTSARKLGIRAKLFFAFAAVSGTTVIAGAAAWLMFSQVRDLFHDVSGRNIPEIVDTLGLQTDTQALAGSAPTLLAAKSQGQRQQEMTALKARQERLAKRLDEVARTQSDREAIDRLKKLIAAMNTKLARARRRGRRSPQAQRPRRGDREGGPEHPDQTQRRAASGRRKGPGRYHHGLDDAGRRRHQTMMTLLKLVSTQVPVSQGFADLVGFVNLASACWTAPRSRRMPKASRRWRRTSRRCRPRSRRSSTSSTRCNRPKACARQGIAWLKLGSGETIFDAPQGAGRQPARQKLLDETRGLTDELAKEVAAQVKAVTNKTKEATDRSDEAIAFPAPS